MDSAGSTPDSYKLELPCPGEPPDPPDDRYKILFFLQDDVPCHKAEVVMNYLKQYENEFTIMDWLCNSPNLNTIENLQNLAESTPKRILCIIEHM